MRKIDKTTILSTVYKAWVDKLEATNQPHPKWGHTTTRDLYYKDLLMSLFYCQDGLCAVTEQLLCSPDKYQANLWKEGKYTAEKPDFFGDVEHFDESLKAKEKDTTGRKDWLWDNLFMVHSNINSRAKGTKTVDTRFKPDTVDYDPNKWFDYDESEHRFIPKGSLEDHDADAAQEMISTLGLNFGPVPTLRKDYLKERLEKARIGPDAVPAPRQFPTAWDFCMASEH